MKKHKLYFKINILLIIFYLIGIFICSFIYRNYISNTNKFLKVPKKLKIINLGSSHGYFGIKYPKNMRSYNLALPSQNLYYDSEILEHYLNNLEENATIIIPISIFSFYNDKDMEDNNDRYYSFLKSKSVYKGSKIKKIELNNFYIFFHPGTILSVGKFLLNSLMNKKLVSKEKEWPKKNWDEKSLIEEANKTTERHLKRKIVHTEHLKRILEICRKNRLIPILITTPQTYLYNERITDKNYIKRIYKHIEQLKKEYNFKYLDYSHDKRFENNLELFLDDDHLNEKGAEKFTKILLKDLKID